jgi:diguanylate cyclase (GGDEF)-like protein
VHLRLPLRPRGSARSRRSPHRRSVIYSLLALAVVPSLGLPVFAGLFTQDRFDDANASRRIGETMTLAIELHDLRTAMTTESASSAMEYFSELYHLTPQEIADLIGQELAVSVEVARKHTDEMFKAVHPDAETQTSLDALLTELLESREVADETLDGDAATVGSGWAMYQTFADLERSVSGTMRATIDRVITGHYGAGSSELLTTVAQLERVMDAVDASHLQGTLVQGLYSAPTDADLQPVVTDLRDATVSWNRLSTDLPPSLSPRVLASWDDATGTPEVGAMNEFLEEIVQPGVAVVPLGTTDVSMAAARSIITRGIGLSALVHESGQEGIAVARADQESAERRAQLALGVTLVLLLITGVLLVVIGGSLRRRLRGLAVAAERFSAGRLEEMPVHGPREIAIAGGALNDAVASFRRVAIQAELLSEGDLDAPELQEAAPGALGLAVHASVQQILDAARARKALQDELAHQAAHDNLTALPNRAETERLLASALARAKRADARVGVLFVDLDQFKRCNDTLGHAAGDHVLRTAAQRMKAAVRPGDTVCRLGGDEFVVVVEPAGSDRSVVEIAQRIVTSLAQPVEYEGNQIVVGGTVGVAISHRMSDTDSLMRESDSAMYLAKSKARGTVEIFDERLRDEIHQETDFKVAMAAAIANNELELHYQPVLDLPSGQITGFEALARWQRPGHGMVGPDQFIPLAESSGLIIDIGQWALRTATAQLIEWSADPEYASLQVAVNLSGRHLAEPGVIDDVQAALDESGLAPDRLVIEITESIAIDSPTTVAHLAALADLGVLIALDDFGTGYTSIGQLLHLPVHILKIDRSFVSGTNEDGSPVLDRSTRIIDLIIEVAHSLDLLVVAEGIEDEVQLAKLKAAQCESAQGYLFSRPLPVDRVTAWVTGHNAKINGRTVIVP